MTINIFALCNDYLGCYDLPLYRKESPTDMEESFRRSVLTDPDGAFQNHAHEKSLFLLGTFDDVSGLIMPLEKPQKLLPLAKLFPPGYLAMKEAQTNGRAN